MREVGSGLYEVGADVVINGHDHDYERFAPQNPDGKAESEERDPGIRRRYRRRRVYAFRNNCGPTARSATTVQYGMMKLTLRPADYSWEYLSAAGEPFQDSGTAPCM